MSDRTTIGAGRPGPGPRHSGGVSTAGLLALMLGSMGHAADASAITIMPMGDSYTYGFSAPANVPGGYRSVLYKDLVAAGDTPTFLGTQTTNPDPSLPAAAQSHEGHIGWDIAGSGSNASVNLASHIDQWLAPGNGVNPNLILLEIGSNEIIGKYHEAAAPYELAALITRISQLRPNAEVLVSTLTPLIFPPANARIQNFNNALSGPGGIVAQLQGRGEKVILVNAGGSLAQSDLSIDGIHPGLKGYTKLGNAWFQGIESFEGNTNALVPHPVPEPSTLVVLGLGALGLIAISRTRPRANPRA